MLFTESKSQAERLAGDRAIVQRAQQKLREKPYSALRKVSCLCHEGTLILRGRLPSYYLKQVAQEVVAEAIDLPILNQIEVRS